MADAWIYSRTRTDADDLSRALVRLGYTTRHVDGADDLMPSGRDGAELRRPELAAIVDRPSLVHRLRGSEALMDIPLLLVTEPGQIPADEAALAHELVVRPFSFAELETRVARATSRGRSAVLRAGALTLDPGRHEVTVAGREVQLTYMEFELLRFLLAHPNRAFSRETLLARVWGYDYYGGARTVDVHVQRLRRKLGGGHAKLIRTIRSVGYLFEGPAAAAA